MSEHGPITPWNPSRRATARVPDGLPAPTCCPYCAGPVELVGNEKIYGRPYGEWPWAYRCTDARCDSYVGLHPFTAIPLGTLADKLTRYARKAAKQEFNALWQHGEMTRTQAYAWLSEAMSLPPERAHIGMFDIEQCRAAMAAVAARASQKPSKPTTASYGTTTSAVGANCGCDVLPWDDCPHTINTETTT